MTRDNLGKRKHVEDVTCLFCFEPESIIHLFFFSVCVSRVVWKEVSEIVDLHLGGNFESTARWWISKKKFDIMNVCTPATLWSGK